MASSAKRLKLSRRKPLSNLESNTNAINNSNPVPSSLSTNKHTSTSSKSSPNSSLQVLRLKLKECLPEMPDWRDFTDFPDIIDDVTDPSHVPLSSTNDKNNTKNKEEPSDSFGTNHVEFSKTTIVNTDDNSGIQEAKNPIIENCPLCPLSFPYDWKQAQIDSHVSAHLDGENFD